MNDGNAAVTYTVSGADNVAINDPVLTVQGGFKTAAIFSGAVAPALTSAPGAVAVGSDVLFQSGQGRLWAVIPHQSYLAMSGVLAQFYDAAAPVSGGPIPASGHIPLGAAAAAYGVSGQLTPAGIPFSFPGGIPFQSGLCYNSRSGQPGVTVIWSREDLANGQ